MARIRSPPGGAGPGSAAAYAILVPGDSRVGALPAEKLAVRVENYPFMGQPLRPSCDTDGQFVEALDRERVTVPAMAGRPDRLRQGNETNAGDGEIHDRHPGWQPSGLTRAGIKISASRTAATAVIFAGAGAGCKEPNVEQTDARFCRCARLRVLPMKLAGCLAQRSGFPAVQALQEFVGGELDVLVPPLGSPVVTGDDAHAVKTAEVAVDEGVPGLGVVPGAIGEPEMPPGVFLPRVRFQEGVLPAGAGLDLTPIAVEHVLAAVNELLCPRHAIWIHRIRSHRTVLPRYQACTPPAARQATGVAGDPQHHSGQAIGGYRAAGPDREAARIRGGRSVSVVARAAGVSREFLHRVLAGSEWAWPRSRQVHPPGARLPDTAVSALAGYTVDGQQFSLVSYRDSAGSKCVAVDCDGHPGAPLCDLEVSDRHPLGAGA